MTLDWDDERALALLTRCHQAMKHRGKVLLVLELDVQMLVSTGGKERTDAEYRSLLGAAGFELTRLIPVLTPFYLIEAVRV